MTDQSADDDYLQLLVFSDDASVREEVKTGVGRRPAKGLPLVAWTEAATAEAKLTGIMTDIHDSCVAAAEEYGRPGDYVLGANAAGFTRVADVMIAHGIV